MSRHRIAAFLSLTAILTIAGGLFATSAAADTPTATTTTTATTTATASPTSTPTTVIAPAPTATGPVYSGTAVKSMTATLVDPAGNTLGAVQLHQDAAGVVEVIVAAAGLTAGDHGVHIHATGKCEGPDFASAGAHFNPGKTAHGKHAGDLPNMTVGSNGAVRYVAVTTAVALLGSGATDINDADGSALVIHAAADDGVTDPSGNSGARVACAVVAPATAPGPPGTGTGLAKSESHTSLAIVLALAGLMLGAGGVATLRKQSSR